MTASLLDGTRVAFQLKQKIKQTVLEMQQSRMRPPSLAVILVGNDSASKIYVQNKRKACIEVGFESLAYDLPSSIKEEDLIQLIVELNESSNIDGILVQLPLPSHINKEKITETINPKKDVDGFHPYNIGRLVQGYPLLRPCTPYGIIQLLTDYQLPLKGKHAVIVGASIIVGRPMALEFLLAGSTTTICHRFTQNLDEFVKMADILVVATGIADVINSEWLNKKQVVVDVGIHRLSNGKLRGDINAEEAKEKVSWLTPVPGGVGPMTIATLLYNTLIAANSRMS